MVDISRELAVIRACEYVYRVLILCKLKRAVLSAEPLSGLFARCIGSGHVVAAA